MPKNVQLSDLPPAYRRQAETQLTGRGQAPVIEAHSVKRVATTRQPNATELRYRASVIDRRPDVVSCHYEALTFRMANGHRYTPDWIVVTTAGRIECHEVKGAYALHSHQRARLAFDQARTEWPCFAWVWGKER